MQKIDYCTFENEIPLLFIVVKTRLILLEVHVNYTIETWKYLAVDLL